MKNSRKLRGLKIKEVDKQDFYDKIMADVLVYHLGLERANMIIDHFVEEKKVYLRELNDRMY